MKMFTLYKNRIITQSYAQRAAIIMEQKINKFIPELSTKKLRYHNKILRCLCQRNCKQPWYNTEMGDCSIYTWQKIIEYIKACDTSTLLTPGIIRRYVFQIEPTKRTKTGKEQSFRRKNDRIIKRIDTKSILIF